MLALRTVPAAAILLLAAACAAPSLSGFAPSDLAPLDERLLGKWLDPKDSESPIFEVTPGEAGRTYDVVVTGHPKGSEGQVRMVVVGVLVGEYLLLDLTLAKEETEPIGQKYGLLLLPTHVFYRADFQSDGLHLTQLRLAWLKERPGIMLLDDEFPLLPADPAGLRETFEAALQDPDAWAEVAVLQRAP